MSREIKTLSDKEGKKKVDWKPSAVTDVFDDKLNPDYKYRWVNKDDTNNLVKKQAEGWEIDNSINGNKIEGYKSLDDGTNTGSTTERRELILMRMPIETAAARKEYYEKKTKQQLQSVVDEAKSGSGGAISGSITDARVIE